ncbi:MAG TPA: methylated-DNA--[protein]-cysteine S-methyltransferase [Gammaproteobacteria bacterium]|nr:methylated-DNA--[protein]-cysteine S-methyltransferase [Gammaproteobacteria bacterium]
MAIAIIRNPDPDYALVLASPLGPLGICLEHSAVTCIDYLPASRQPVDGSSAGARRVARALERYFADGSRPFGLPVQLGGTDFQQRVWQALCDIPPGQTRTYGELARQLGSGARAVGNACRHNPVPVVVPCHRVVSSSGPGGYGGHMSGPPLRRKRWLLEHEGVAFQGLKKR